jgi:hypothetical protein
MDKTAEQQVSETILQAPEEVIIDGERYTVSPPSTGTLILASEAISKLPVVSLSSENVLNDSLYIAKDCRILGDIVAILILGAKRLTETVTTKHLFGLVKHIQKIDNKAILAEKILNELSPHELNDLLAKLLIKTDVAFFFATIISLIEVNLTKATKTTASGQ